MRRWLVAAFLAVAGSASAEEELPNAVPTVMYKRWSAAMSYGAGGVRARSTDLDKVPMVAFELALRYRLIPVLEASICGNGLAVGPLGYLGFMADVRYRFMAEMPWNPHVMVGVGLVSWGAERPRHLITRTGAGLERRFKSWAFSLDAQLTRTNDDASVMARNVASTFEHDGVLGASLSVAALYYWGRGGRPLNRHGVP